MTKHKFNVEFYYKTDLRTNILVHANNEAEALVVIQNSLSSQAIDVYNWCDEKGFWIRIEIYE